MVGFLVFSCVDVLVEGISLLAWFVVDSGVLTSVVGGNDDRPVDGTVDGLPVDGSFSGVWLDSFVVACVVWVDGTIVPLVDCTSVTPLVDGTSDGTIEELLVDGAPEELCVDVVLPAELWVDSEVGPWVDSMPVALWVDGAPEGLSEDGTPEEFWVDSAPEVEP